jgi:hypothetical protein
MNIPVHLEPGLEDVEVSDIIRTPPGKPVIVERAMYLTNGGLFYAAGHESTGIRAPQLQWFFAEGATVSFFDLFILVGNPNDAVATLMVTFLFDDGTVCGMPMSVDPLSRFNIWVDDTVVPGCARSLADAAVSTMITSDRPVIAERTMWWPGPPSSWTEAHNAAGATVTGTLWGVAGGEQGGNRSAETYLLIANTSAWGGSARVTLYFEDGTSATQTVDLAPNSRTNVAIGAGGFGVPVTDRRFGAVVESQASGDGDPPQIVVERAIYSDGPGAPFWAAGSNVLATRLQ